MISQEAGDSLLIPKDHSRNATPWDLDASIALFWFFSASKLLLTVHACMHVWMLREGDANALDIPNTFQWHWYNSFLRGCHLTDFEIVMISHSINREILCPRHDITSTILPTGHGPTVEESPGSR